MLALSRPCDGDALNPETSVMQVLKEARPLYKRNPRPPIPEWRVNAAMKAP